MPETTDPDIKKVELLRPGMGTRDYDLEEARDARRERTEMQESHRKEKADLLKSFDKGQAGKNLVIYMLIAANLFQAALILGQNLSFSGGGVEVSTGDAETPATEHP